VTSAGPEAAAATGERTSAGPAHRPAALWAYSVVGAAIAWLVLRPNLWFGVLADSAFYQSLAAAGRQPIDHGQDLAYFPARLSYLIPSRLVNGLLEGYAGFVTFRVLFVAVFLGCLVAIARPRRPWVAAVAGVVAGASPTMVGWFAQDYPTMVTALLGVVIAALLLRWPTPPKEPTTILLALGACWAGVAYSHWGPGLFLWPLGVWMIVKIVRRSPLRTIVRRVLALGAGIVAAMTAMSLMGELLFGVGAPWSLVEMNIRGIRQIENVDAFEAALGVQPWTWIEWHSSFALFLVALAVPLLDRLLLGRWGRASAPLSLVLIGQLSFGLVLPRFLATTQHTIVLFAMAVALVVILTVHLLEASANDLPRKTRSLPAWLAALVAPALVSGAVWAMLLLLQHTSLDLVPALGWAVVGVLVLALLISRGRSTYRLARLLGSAGILVALTFAIPFTQGIPPGVIPQGYSEERPDVPPVAWFDYHLIYAAIGTDRLNENYWLQADQVVRLTYPLCPSGYRMLVWPTLTPSPYPLWSVFSPYNSTEEGFPAITPTDEQTLSSGGCLVAIGSDEVEWDDSVDGARLVLDTVVGMERLGSQRLRLVVTPPAAEPA